MDFIPYGRQDINQTDIDSVVSVLNSDFLTQGPMVPKFENAVSVHCGAKHSFAVNSATSALHIACLALGLTEGDWLWTSPITFVASANCALYCGAQVDFVDIDPKTYNLSPEALEAKLIEAEKKGRLPKIVVPVHLCGQSCDMQAIHDLSIKYGFKIIEDASHAIGGKYKDHYIGGCQYSDITVLSFHPVKIITTAEGGMLLTQNDHLAEKINLLRSHGITRDTNQMEGDSHGPWYYEQIDLGYNYRMTELQASLGVTQMRRLDQFVTARHERVKIYSELLKDVNVVSPYEDPDAYSAYHLYVIRLPEQSNVRKKRYDVFESMRAAGIGVNVHYIPVYSQPYYQKHGFATADFPEAEKYYASAISLPLFPKLTREQQQHIVKTLVSCI